MLFPLLYFPFYFYTLFPFPFYGNSHVMKDTQLMNKVHCQIYKYTYVKNWKRFGNRNNTMNSQSKLNKLGVARETHV